MDSRFKPRKTTMWERQLGASSSAYNDDSMDSMVGGIGGVPSRVPGARHERGSKFQNTTPPRLPEVYKTDNIGLLHGNYDYLQVARYSLKDKTSEIGRFATFSNPKRRDL